ncbi:DUF86 domain-containing protein [Spirulina sp. CS-785/01]|uniref:HepT-like ribonuclease domain-containing protein n=1 Tax=Spirulina sp. CS-785/01 TaxID=3021716 RepID=UPI0023307F88|nr:HepT-like ribonuclease domain-containing protein [Spirulina sp. CS-785/01]MDB9313466.1 DUF86 domain-containing protein [Spirulina sp. CS-785/01]
MQRDKEAILDIIESITKILVYTENVTFNEFITNEEKQDAILRRILIIGEATKRLSTEFKQNHPDIPYCKLQQFAVNPYLPQTCRVCSTANNLYSLPLTKNPLNAPSPFIVLTNTVRWVD